MKPEIPTSNLTEEQLKALYDPIRVRIAHQLKTPRTPKQVAEIINIKPNNLYYHFRVLEKAGIIELVGTKPGKGFIKENFYKLKSEEIKVTPQMVPLGGRMRFLQNLMQAEMEDLGESIDKHDKIVGFAARDDFSFPEEKLEEAREIIIRRKTKLLEELGSFQNPEGECNYQLSVFSFKL